jgi:hypothetical protein
MGQSLYRNTPYTFAYMSLKGHIVSVQNINTNANGEQHDGKYNRNVEVQFVDARPISLGIFRDLYYLVHHKSKTLSSHKFQ